MKKGFSLVELSIVLVILGLLVGGVLAGKSLIRAAELRSITTEYDRYRTATYAFRDKYFFLPGDMSNATAFWGKDASACNADSGSAATPGTCNGNGNGVYYLDNSGSYVTKEYFQAWKQLALANLIEGSYTGLSGLSGIHTEVGSDIPSSRFGAKSGWTFGQGHCYAGANCYAFDYGTFLSLTITATQPQALLKPEEMWNIDSKLDDGLPASGKVFVSYGNVAQSGTCTTSTSNTDFTGLYNLSNSGIACGPYFKLF